MQLAEGSCPHCGQRLEVRIVRGVDYFCTCAKGCVPWIAAANTQEKAIELFYRTAVKR